MSKRKEVHASSLLSPLPCLPSVPSLEVAMKKRYQCLSLMGSGVPGRVRTRAKTLPCLSTHSPWKQSTKGFLEGGMLRAPQLLGSLLTQGAPILILASLSPTFLGLNFRDK